MSLENQNFQMNTQANNASVEIDLGEIFHLLWTHVLQILLCCVLGAVLAFGYTSFFITPMYSSTATLYILNTSSSANETNTSLADIQISNNLVNDYKELITSRVILQETIDNLKLDYTETQLGNMVTVDNPTNTLFVNITVTTDSAKQSASIANELAKETRIYVPEVMKTEAPSIFGKAIAPTKKSSPSTTKNTLIGGLLAAFLYIAILVVKFVMNDTIVTPDDVEKYLGISTLASIPEANLGDFNKKKKAKKGKK